MNAIRAKQNITVKSATILQGDSRLVYIDLGYLARRVQHYLLLQCFLLQVIVKSMALNEVPFLSPSEIINLDYSWGQILTAIQLLRLFDRSAWNNKLPSRS